MKEDKCRSMTERLRRKLAERGITLPPETTIHRANQILCEAIVAEGKKLEETK